MQYPVIYAVFSRLNRCNSFSRYRTSLADSSDRRRKKLNVAAIIFIRGHPYIWRTTVREFLSDAPFFGLSLCTEFQLANCACVSGWSCLTNLGIEVSPFGHFVVAGLVPARNVYVHSEVEVHTVYQRLFKTLAKVYTPCNTYIFMLLLC